jgi:hypothetical protein
MVAKTPLTRLIGLRLGNLLLAGDRQFMATDEADALLTGSASFTVS